MEMLHEAQEELKNLRNKNLPLSTPRRFHSLGLFPMDSLAAEIEGTMRKELQMDDPEVEEQKLHPKRVFETVKNLNQIRQRSLGPSPMNIPGSNQTSGRSSSLGTPRSSLYGGETGSSIVIDNRTNSIILGSSDDGSEDSNRKPGTPGTPGSQDLEAALRRLTLRRDNYLSERRFFEEERERKLAELAGKGELYSGSQTPTESIMSLGSHPSLGSVWSGYSFSARSYLPEKLQIVKPLEGSATLHQWQQLAQPHLGGILDPRPGVVTKGFRQLELDQEQVYQFTDLEEDEGSADPARDPALARLSTSGGGHAPFSLSPSSSSSSFCVLNGVHDNSDSPSQRTGAEAGGGAGGDTPPPPPPSLSPPLLPGASGGKADPQDQTSTADGVSVHFPGKCMSHTSSTYTFTTCRILHPSDELTRVTPSLMSGPASSCVVSSVSSSVRSTPASTPRRLSLAESFTNQRDSTTTTSTSLGLVRLLQERGISAAMYDPQSWDRADSSASTSPVGASPALQPPPPRPPDVLPYTPPNSPDRSPVSPFQFSPTAPLYDNFLASKPASSILREVRGAEGGAEGGAAADGRSQAEASVQNLRLVDKLKRFRTVSPGASAGGMLGPLGGLHRAGPPFGPGGVSSSPIGGLPVLNVGMRRNRSYPAMVGASMAMKGPGPPSPEILIPSKLHKQTSLNND